MTSILNSQVDYNARLYPYVRKASGKQATGWRESFCSIYTKSASSGSFKLFKSRLRDLIKKQGLSHYLLQ